MLSCSICSAAYVRVSTRTVTVSILAPNIRDTRVRLNILHEPLESEIGTKNGRVGYLLNRVMFCFGRSHGAHYILVSDRISIIRKHAALKRS